MIDIQTNKPVISAIASQANGRNAKKAILKYFIQGKCQEISYEAFRNAIDLSATQIKSKVEKIPSINDKGYVPVGFLSDSSAAYLVHFIALMRLNLTPIAMSPRNTVPIQIHLLKQSESPILVYHKDFQNEADQCKKEIPNLQLIEIEEPNYETEPCTIDPIVILNPTNGNFGEQIAVILHSSGSTAYPKLITLPNRYFYTALERNGKSPSNIFNGNGLVLTPFYHAYGFLMFIQAIYHSGSLSLSSETRLTPKSILKDLKSTQSTFALMLPYHLINLVDYCDNFEPKGWKQLSSLEVIQSAGAVLPKQVGDRYNQHNVNIGNGYGATEIGIIAFSVLEPESIRPCVFQLHKELKYHLFNKNDNLTQIIIDKNDAGLAPGTLGPDEEGYVVGDLFRIVEHKPEEDLFRFEILGRADDIIVHLSGEKSNPIPIENEIISNSYVDKCFVYGNGKLYNCAFIELKKKAIQNVPLLQLTSSILKQVENANKYCPSHSRVLSELIYILPIDGEKTLPITAKGNIIRKKCIMQFKKEIEELYLSFEDSKSLQVASDEGIENDSHGLESIKKSIKSCFSKSTQRSLVGEKSFFSSGMDSLSVVKFRNLLLSKYGKLEININDIYEMDNIETLSSFIDNFFSGNQKESKSIEEYQGEVDQLITEYSNFSEINPSLFLSNPLKRTGKMNVLITGANGSLGSFIIKALLKRDDIGTIYGLARASSAEESIKRIREGFEERKVTLTEDQWSHVVGLPYITDDVKLGLDDITYNEVVNSVDIIYHVAWRMNFLKAVFSFKDCIESTVNLLKICATSPRQSSFNFTSTIGATVPVNDGSIIKEDQLSTKLKNVEACNGYNLSKLVSETLCHLWAEKFGFSLDIYRVGQVSGDTVNGAWNVKEHIPVLLKAAKVMEMVPHQKGKVAWIPVDTAGNAIAEISLSLSNPHNGTTSHIFNPKGYSWSVVYDSLRSAGIKFDVVDSSKFIHTLRNKPKYQDAETNPIASLTDFFASSLTDSGLSFTFETSQTENRSKFITTCPPVDESLVHKYINFWEFNGFLKL